MIGDYLLTFWGIHTLGYIEELNPLMIWFMELPLYLGLALRVVYAGLLLLIIRWGISKLPHQPFYNKLPIALLGIQALPYAMHMIWLYKYFTV
jgi:hypothetical protein